MRFRLLKLSMLPLSWYRLPPRNSPGSQFSLQAQNTKRKSTPMECSFVGETSPGRRQAAYRQVRSALGDQCKKRHPVGCLFCIEYRLLKRYFYTALNFLLASFTVPLFLSSLNLQTTMKLIERRAV